MRLLFVSNLFPPHAIGGYEQNCGDIARVMQVMGHQVDVITSTYGVQGPVREPGIWRILRLRRDYGTEPDRKKAAVGRGRVDVDRHNLEAIRAELVRTAPDATLLWGGGNLGPLPSLLAEGHGPTVYNIADEWLLPLLQPPRGGLFRRSGRALYRRLLGAPDVQLRGPLVFVSAALRERYRSQGARINLSRVNHLGVDPDVFHPQPQAINREADTRKILFVGRVDPLKGTTTLLRAFGRLSARPGLPQLHLTIVGSATPEREAELRSTAAQEAVTDRVRILGPVPRGELPGLYAEHDVLAFPSEWFEPFALTPLEAMACGVPVVSSLAGGSSELVRDRENALAFRAGDAEDLADKLAWVLTHREESAAMGQRASEEVRSKYTLRSEADGLLATITEAISAAPGPAAMAV